MAKALPVETLVSANRFIPGLGNSVAIKKDTPGIIESQPVQGGDRRRPHQKVAFEAMIRGNPTLVSVVIPAGFVVPLQQSA